MTSILQPTVFFTGRAAFLTALHATLRERRLVAISGPGGIGKTTIARAYARQFGPQYRRTLWLNVATRELSLLAGIGLASILDDLPLAPAQGLDKILPALRNWLDTHQDVLLVLDNADDPALLQELLPSRPTGFVLLTTQTAPPAATSLAPGPLTPEEGALLLARRAGLVDPATACEDATLRALAGELENLPLALDLAGAFLRETDQDLPAYLQTCRAARLPGRSALGTLCALTLAHLDRQRPLAAAILRFCTCLAPDAIPLELLARGATTPGSPLQDIAHHPDALAGACQLLCAYGLIDIQEEAETLSVHPLIQAAIQALSAPVGQQLAREALMALHTVMPTSAQQVPAASHLCYLMHIRRAAGESEQLTASFREAAEVFSWAAQVLHAQGAYTESARLLQRALTTWETLLGPTHAIVPALQHHLASLYAHLERYHEAETLLYSAITTRAQTLGAAHLDTLVSLHNLGVVYARQGKTSHAQQTFEKALTLCERSHSRAHPVTAAIQCDLATLYLAQQQWAQAEALLQLAYPCHERTLGAEHSATTRLLHDLARAAIGQQQWAQARQVLERVSAGYERTLGPEHPTTRQALRELAAMYAACASWAQAEALFLRLCTQAPVERETTQLQHALALVYLSQAKWSAAESLLEQVLSAYTRAPEKPYPALIECLELLLVVALQQEHTAEAASIAHTLQQVREEQIRQTETPDMAALHQLAGIYLGQGRLAEAEQLLRQAMAGNGQQAELGLPASASELSVLAIASAHHGEQAAAISLLWQALATWEEALGPQHPDIGPLREDYRELIEQFSRATEPDQPGG